MTKVDRTNSQQSLSGDPSYPVGPFTQAFAQASSTSSFVRNPRQVAETFVNRQGYKMEDTQRPQVIKYIERRFLQVSDQRMDGVLKYLATALRDNKGRPLAGDALLKRLHDIDQTDGNNAQALSNIGGAVVSALAQPMADISGFLGKMLIAPPLGAMVDPSAMERFRRQSAALDEFFSQAGDKAARIVGADPNSPLYREGKSAAELALVIAGVLHLAPDALQLARMGKEVVLVFKDARTFQRAINDPELQKKLAIVISNRNPRAIALLPKGLKIKVRKILKEWPEDPSAVNALGKIPTTPRSDAIVDRIAQKLTVVTDRHREASFEYKVGNGQNHFIDGRVIRRNGHYELNFSFRSDPRFVGKSGGGTDMFNAVMKRLKKEGIEVDVVIGNWSGENPYLNDNYEAFKRLQSMGKSREEAALLTPTGRLAEAHGYKNVNIVKDGEFVIVHFTK
ncbi:hypothetical protein SAMN06265795_104206 [Noviherbaspirillum humi]|uniref:Uncharacterized protein n=1 Tax=Noviherbaspirillum humi TaxID=1688639 RepID=A0A239G1V2_9BURK|nr:hypothetical protein [Noviherbaspirillum humi]SNS63030.1 hypothetical protein SAMN06265795_104206 [Noviherbaspirillum humi]